MNLSDLSPAKGANAGTKRKGRGIGSGNGKTSGRGQGGQWSRSGGGVRPGFEGGQMPLQRRIPKRGFNNIFAKKYTDINVSELEKLQEGIEVTAEVLKEAGIISKIQDGVKLMGRGELTKKFTVKGIKLTKTAEEKILAAGGKIEVK